MIKVLAIIAMIIFGVYLLITADVDSTVSISNLWSHGGFFPNGFEGLFYMLAFMMFAFGGIELISMAAAETENPDQNIPKAINQIVLRVFLFYICSLAILLSLVPWNQLNLGDLEHSPFVMIFSQMGISWAAHLLNFIILTASLSVCNSGMYANSRMLLGLAEQGNAPQVFKQLNKQGIPIPAVLFSALLIFGCVLLNYFLPEKALSYLIYIVVAAAVLNWIMISLIHLKFRKAMQGAGIESKFPAVFAPFTNYLVLAFMLMLLYIMWTQGFMLSVLMLPVWIAVLFGVFKFGNKKAG